MSNANKSNAITYLLSARCVWTKITRVKAKTLLASGSVTQLPRVVRSTRTFRVFTGTRLVYISVYSCRPNGF